jgi:hypothetical protein
MSFIKDSYPQVCPLHVLNACYNVFVSNRDIL